MAICTSRHSRPMHCWVYQATQPSQYTIGFIMLPNQANIPLGLLGCQQSQSMFRFIRLLRQWTGRIAKLVSSFTELRTPPQDLSGLASTIPTHPTQVSPSLLHNPSSYTFPSSALQDVHRKFTSHSYLIVRFHTRFIKHILRLFHYSIVHSSGKNNKICTTRHIDMG